MAYAMLSALGVTVLYLASQVVHRLFLSPLRSVPGPKLAALSGCYEMYYDLVQKARFPWKLIDLHQQYGMTGYPVSRSSTLC